MSYVTNENLNRYRNMSEEELKKEIIKNNFLISKSYGAFNQATKVSGAKSKSDLTGGVVKRLRKENARIHTILNERRLGIK